MHITMSISEHTVLILPFNTQFLQDPTPVLPLIYRATQESQESCTILFSSPVGDLYKTLRESPRKYWDTFQRFLGKVYATLSAVQWGVGRVSMDVEVGFEGYDLHTRFAGKEVRVIHLSGKFVDYTDRGTSLMAAYMDLPVMAELRRILGKHTGQTIPTPTSLTPSPERIDSLDSISNPTPLDNTAQEPPTSDLNYPTTALGGTFDHLHAAHKLLLHLALFLTSKRLIVGLMTQSLLSSKSNYELLEPLEDRIDNVRQFLQRQSPEVGEGEGVELDIVEIHDPFGPTAWDGDIQALVVSKETLSGGEAVNRKRREKGLGELDVWVIDVIAAEGAAQPIGESGSGKTDQVGKGGVHGKEGGVGKTRDLSHVNDEGELKALKMGSTAIRQWIKDHPNP